MSGQNKVSGVVLAGGMARRMGKLDKGLLLFQGKPLVSYALAAMHGVTEDIVINANRSQDYYKLFGYPVIDDGNSNFNGPLAGILAAMQNTHAETLVVMPCDSPLLTTGHLQRLLAGLKGNIDIVVAHDGQRLHPVVMALKTRLQSHLDDYLKQGHRKLHNWILQHQWQAVDFADTPHIFANINTLADLAELENQI